jgi:hypothetical protein
MADPRTIGNRVSRRVGVREISNRGGRGQHIFQPRVMAGSVAEPAHMRAGGRALTTTTVGALVPVAGYDAVDFKSFRGNGPTAWRLARTEGRKCVARSDEERPTRREATQCGRGYRNR